MPIVDLLHEKPIQRMDAAGNPYFITVSMDPGAADLSRVGKGQVKLLADHQATLSNTLGNVTRAWIEDKTLKIDFDWLDVPNDPAIQKAQKMVESGHHGYSAAVHGKQKPRRTGPNSFRQEKWILMEATLTPIPADDDTATVALRFNADADAAIEEMLKEETAMAENDATAIASAVSAAMVEANEKLATSIVDGLAEKFGSLFVDGKKVEDGAPPTPDTKADAAPDKPADTQATATPPDKPAPADTTATATATDKPAPAVDHTDRLNQMMESAKKANKYSEADLAAAHLEAIGSNSPPADFLAKIQTLTIQSNPVVPPLDTGEQKFNVGAALIAHGSGDWSDAQYELSISNDIKKKSNVFSAMRPGVAIPLEAIPSMTELLTASAGDAAKGGAAVPDLPIIFERKDIPDALDAEAFMALLTNLPSGPGDPKIVQITTGDPTMVAEPAQQALTGRTDIGTEPETMSPKLLFEGTEFTRLLELQSPGAVSFASAVIMAKMREQQAAQILFGDGSGNNATGIYNLADVHTSADITTDAGVTTTLIRTAIRQSVGRRAAADNRALVVSPYMEGLFRDIASPPSVAAFYQGGQIDQEVPVLMSGYMSDVQTKNYRAVVGPWSAARLKNWDGAVYAFSKYDSGVFTYDWELYWNFLVTQPQLFSRVQQN